MVLGQKLTENLPFLPKKKNKKKRKDGESTVPILLCPSCTQQGLPAFHYCARGTSGMQTGRTNTSLLMWFLSKAVPSAHTLKQFGG